MTNFVTCELGTCFRAAASLPGGRALVPGGGPTELPRRPCPGRGATYGGFTTRATFCHGFGFAGKSPQRGEWRKPGWDGYSRTGRLAQCIYSWISIMAFMVNIGLPFSFPLYRKWGRTITLKYVKEQKSAYKRRCLTLIEGHSETGDLILSNYKMFPAVDLTEWRTH